MNIARTMRWLIMVLFSAWQVWVHAEVPEHIRTVLTQKCVYCHVTNNAARARFPIGPDLNEKTLQEYRGRILEQMEYGMMPPLTVDKNLQTTSAEAEAISKFVETLKPAVSKPPPPVAVAPTPPAESKLCLSAAAVPAADKNTRYISLAGIQFKSEADKDLYIQAVNKVLNSVSLNPTLSKVDVVGDGSLLRVDLRKYNLNTPAKIAALDKALGTGPTRADKFVTTVSKPPLYNTLLELPRNVKDLKTKYLGRGKTGMFAGTTKSGVSSQNRAFGCYDGTYGTFCESYDYLGRKDGGDGGRAIFRDPLNLQSNGGEYIFSLPNGMLGYFLSQANGTEVPDVQKSINVGPTEVVQAPFRRDKAIINGQTCMACHHNGLIPKKDEVRDFATKNFQGAKLAKVHEKFVPYENLKATLDRDNAKVVAAQTSLGITSPVDPVNDVVTRYEEGLRSRTPACVAGRPTAPLTAGDSESGSFFMFTAPVSK